MIRFLEYYVRRGDHSDFPLLVTGYWNRWRSEGWLKGKKYLRALQILDEKHQPTESVEFLMLFLSSLAARQWTDLPNLFPRVYENAIGYLSETINTPILNVCRHPLVLKHPLFYIQSLSVAATLKQSQGFERDFHPSLNILETNPFSEAQMVVLKEEGFESRLSLLIDSLAYRCFSQWITAYYAVPEDQRIKLLALFTSLTDISEIVRRWEAYYEWRIRSGEDATDSVEYDLERWRRFTRTISEFNVEEFYLFKKLRHRAETPEEMGECIKWVPFILWKQVSFDEVSALIEWIETWLETGSTPDCQTKRALIQACRSLKDSMMGEKGYIYKPLLKGLARWCDELVNSGDAIICEGLKVLFDRCRDGRRFFSSDQLIQWEDRIKELKMEAQKTVSDGGISLSDQENVELNPPEGTQELTSQREDLDLPKAPEQCILTLMSVDWGKPEALKILSVNQIEESPFSVDDVSYAHIKRQICGNFSDAERLQRDAVLRFVVFNLSHGDSGRLAEIVSLWMSQLFKAGKINLFSEWHTSLSQRFSSPHPLRDHLLSTIISELLTESKSLCSDDPQSECLRVLLNDKEQLNLFQSKQGKNRKKSPKTVDRLCASLALLTEISGPLVDESAGVIWKTLSNTPLSHSPRELEPALTAVFTSLLRALPSGQISSFVEAFRKQTKLKDELLYELFAKGVLAHRSLDLHALCDMLRLFDEGFWIEDDRMIALLAALIEKTEDQSAIERVRELSQDLIPLLADKAPGFRKKIVESFRARGVDRSQKSAWCKSLLNLEIPPLAADYARIHFEESSSPSMSDIFLLLLTDLVQTDFEQSLFE
ncbi:MAG: hypothetical protein KDK40_04845, partial [Chlamydiia bacterium]|nr:hypothetical protein [Chlamydiia bacterium]